MGVSQQIRMSAQGSPSGSEGQNSTLDTSEYVRVKNNTGSDLKGRYDGQDYLFRDGGVTDVHHLVAAHIFGFGQDDKMQAFHRLGWLNDGRSYDDALLRLSDLEFGEVPSPAISIRAAKNRKTAGTAERITSPTPLADGDAEVGEVVRTASPIDAPTLPPSEESEEL